jgi:RNA polymerase sigma-70 factor (ECF subfamily)
MPPDFEAMVARVLAGDESAWPRLWQAVEPRLYGMLRRPNLIGRLSQSEDDCRNIVVDVMARLRADGYGRLARFAEARAKKPALPFMAWLVVVAQRVAIDYMRAHDEYRDRRHDKDASRPGAWFELDTLPAEEDLGRTRTQITAQATAHEILRFARAELPEGQVVALEAWLEGGSMAEIAVTLALDPQDVVRRVRAALERIRRRFGPASPGGDA